MENEMVSNLLTSEDCHKILGKYVGSQKSVRVLNYKVTKANENVLGFLGDYFRLKINFELDTNNSTTLENVIFFVKTVPIYNKNQRDFVQECGIFQKEAFIYKNILPQLTEIAGINFAPCCFMIGQHMIVLEDLRVKNFKSQKADYTLEECQALVMCLALFHGSSIVYEEQKSSQENPFRFGTEYEKNLVEGTFSFSEGNPKNMWLKTVTNCIKDFCETLPNFEDDSLIKKFHEVVYGGQLENFIKPSERYRNVLTHNDLWANNMMFNDNMECVLIDFQQVRYTPPAYDLIMALFFNNSQEFLAHNFEKMVNIYYNTFSCLLEHYGLNPKVLFPQDEFLESIEVYKLPALIEAAFFATSIYLPEDRASFILSDAEQYKDFLLGSRAKYSIDIFKDDTVYRRKILGIIEPMVNILSKL